MIAKAGHARAAQGGGTMNFEPVTHFDNLRAHGAQVVGDGSYAIGFLNAQLLRMADNGCAVCQRTGNRQYGQLIDELRHFFSLNDRAFERGARDFNDPARFKLIDILDGFAHLRSHSH